MATAHVGKGTNRAAAQGRRERAAQRTPLPPKGAIKSAAQRKAARSEEQERLDEVRPSDTKAALFAADAKAAGWETTTHAEDDTITVTSKRSTPEGEEVLVAFWISGRVTERNLPTYTRLGKTVALRNVARARRILDGSEPMVIKAGPAPRVSKARRTHMSSNGDEPATEGAPPVPMARSQRVRLTARAKGKAPINVESIGMQQRETLTRIFEEDGYSVNTEIFDV